MTIVIGRRLRPDNSPGPLSWTAVTDYERLLKLEPVLLARRYA